MTNNPHDIQRNITYDLQFEELANNLFVQTNGDRKKFKEATTKAKITLLGDIPEAQQKAKLAKRFDEITGNILQQQSAIIEQQLVAAETQQTMNTIETLGAELSVNPLDLSGRQQAAADALYKMAETGLELGQLGRRQATDVMEMAVFEKTRNQFLQTMVNDFEGEASVGDGAFEDFVKQNEQAFSAASDDFTAYLDSEWGQYVAPEEDAQENERLRSRYLSLFLSGELTARQLYREYAEDVDDNAQAQFDRYARNERAGNNSGMTGLIQALLQGEATMDFVVANADYFYPPDAQVIARIGLMPELANNGVFLEYVEKIQGQFGDELDYQPMHRFLAASLHVFETQGGELTPAEQREVLHARFNDAVKWGAEQKQNIEMKLEQLDESIYDGLFPELQKPTNEQLGHALRQRDVYGEPFPTEYSHTFDDDFQASAVLRDDLTTGPHPEF